MVIMSKIGRNARSSNRRKTIVFRREELERIKSYQLEASLSDFSEAVRVLIRIGLRLRTVESENGVSEQWVG